MCALTCLVNACEPTGRDQSLEVGAESGDKNVHQQRPHRKHFFVRPIISAAQVLGPPLELTENQTETGPVCEVAPAKCVKVIPVAIPGEARGRCEPGELLFKSDQLLF